MFSWIDLLFLMPELTLFAATILLMLAGLYGGASGRQFVQAAAPIGVVCALYFAINLPSGAPEFLMNGLVQVDGFTQFAKVLILLSTLLAMVLASYWKRGIDQGDRFEFPLLMMLASLGMCLMVSSADMLSLYLGLELMSLSLYVLTAYHRDDRMATEAGMKYFVLGSLASGLILFGISYLYGFTGTTNFMAMGEFLGSSGSFAQLSVQQFGILLGMIFLLVGFCFKISAVPFHMWAPDVYQGAPTPVTAFLSTVPKVAAVLVLVRLLLEPLGDWIMQWQQIIIFVSVASMIIGALGAMVQTNIKRMLAFSSIGHVGYVLVAIAAGTQEGLQAVLIYLALYIFMSIGAFGCVLLMQRDGKAVESIDELGGIAQKHPYFALLMAAFMFSLAGIPPLAGFFGKFYVFLAALNAGLIGLAIIGVLTSVIGAYYYLRVVKVMYFDAERDGFDAEMTGSLKLVLCACAAVTLLYIVIPAPLIEAAHAAAGALWL
ncbi:MAG: NADH-quinone oxidoreductase subunit NuoN [Rickettsiales bacterium]|nr:NADH-quinone oxidoreductase subunit NuoN [Rickettsiales bacterium]